MATLLLTALGTALGGPLGGAIGALAGQRVDQALFAPKGRVGARLADLSVQSSAYGSPIPRLYGRARVSGTVIWSTDLREERRRVSQGKGRPKATVFSYSASFAVLLAARRIRGIGRIWADGKLLRGAAGDVKIETGLRIHEGAPDQPIDPLIASAEGAAAPAYRGRAYVVLEDMALESFGNRIPMLSFEVFADGGAVAVSALVEDLAAPMVDAQGGGEFEGYAAAGGSIANAIAALDRVVDLQWRDRGDRLLAGPPQDLPVATSPESLGASPDQRIFPPVQKQRASASALATRVEIGFSDPARDYQAGVQAVDLRTDGRSESLDLPAILNAERAAALARDLLLAIHRNATSLDLRVPWRQLALWSSDLLALDGETWRIRSIRLEAMCLVIALSPHVTRSALQAPVDGGRATAERDEMAGRTVLALVDLPPLDAVVATTPQVVAIAAGTGTGWRSAALLQRNGTGGTWTEIGGTAAPGVIGALTRRLPLSAPHLLDLENTITAELVNDEANLFSVTDDALWSGANAAMVGEELIQFGAAEKAGPRLWRLSRLLRGRRGTNSPADGHGIGTPFILLDRDQLVPLTVPAGLDALAVLAKGVGDPSGVEAHLAAPGRALRPLLPVHVTAVHREDGAHVAWVRQSREGWQWPDGVDVPLGEEAERYRIALRGTSSGRALEVETSTPERSFTPDEVQDFRAAGDLSLEITVRQVGRFALSEPAHLTLPF